MLYSEVWVGLMKCEIFVHSLRRKIFFEKQFVVFHIFIFLRRSPGRSSPRLCAGDESGFFYGKDTTNTTVCQEGKSFLFYETIASHFS